MAVVESFPYIICDMSVVQMLIQGGIKVTIIQENNKFLLYN